ncbi:hypothetical protein OG352_08130 [Streptomyces sp. NBC_01485]|uniref:hypothetical protein n=1 Tax=Streptomyces sp. NBC_01485 TaxID=2903884 RepID=UPI002E37B20F|nr:hypothetical protein [Streptomyces sp. NBC_01485]
MFKTLLATAGTVPEEEARSPVHLANSTKRGDVDRLDAVLVPLVFFNERAWSEQDDGWVAECLAEWLDPDTEGLFRSSLREDAGQSELEMFVDAFGGVVEQWRVQNEQARPQPNPDFDPAEPVEGTQFYKYAKLPGTDEFQWLYASEPDSADWQILQVRYDRYEADAAEQHTEAIEPYGDHFMKAVDGRWTFGATRSAATWYDDYQKMLEREGLLSPAPEAPGVASAPDEVQPYGDHFMKLTDGRWTFGASRDAAVWYDDYQEMLEQEGLIPAAPVSVRAAVQAFQALQADLDERVFQPEAALTAGEAAEILSSDAGQEFAEALNQTLLDMQAEQFETLLMGTEGLSEEELKLLLDRVRQ